MGSLSKAVDILRLLDVLSVRVVPLSVTQVSTWGGLYPRRRPDGSELYYVRPRGDMMAAPIAASGTMPVRDARMVRCTSRVAGTGNERWGLVCAAIRQ